MKNRIHFIGIGGIGISAIARYYKRKGYIITGSDDSMGENLNLLIDSGIQIFYPTNKNNLYNLQDKDKITKIIYTGAIDNNNPELLLAKELAKEYDFPILTYPQALAEIIHNKKSIAIAGTHGKTTTTALCYYGLLNAGLNVSAIVGSLIDGDRGKTNYLYNENNLDKEEYIIIESCEYKRNFLHYYPDYIIITNIDEDHLDYYKDINDIKLSFWEFINNLKNNGKVFLHNNDYKDIIYNFVGGILNRIYSIFNSRTKYKDNYGKDISIINSDKLTNDRIDLQIIGAHNRNNASLVLSLGKELGLDEKLLRDGLYSYEGSWRRQEYKGKYRDVICYDDYAHTPVEIRETIKAFREDIAKHKNIIVLFMPHLQSRVQLSLDNFVKELSLADYLIIAPIYLARKESPEYADMNNKVLVKYIKDYSINKDKGDFIWAGENNQDIKVILDNLLDKLKSNNQENIIITMGAGPIDEIYKILK